MAGTGGSAMVNSWKTDASVAVDLATRVPKQQLTQRIYDIDVLEKERSWTILKWTWAFSIETQVVARISFTQFTLVQMGIPGALVQELAEPGMRCTLVLFSWGFIIDNGFIL